MRTRNVGGSARAPTRIDFGGGWTDVPPYPAEEGGFVCNIAIDRFAVATIAQGSANAASDPESALALAARTRLQPEGYPAATLHLESDFPVGAGLGGSSAAGVAAVGAMLTWRGETIDRSGIAELSRKIEVEDLGIAGGRQDHYAAAYGGALGLTFSADSVSVEQISLSPLLIEELERRCILVYTGRSRISGETITAVLNGYRDRDRQVCSALARMKQLALLMRDALQVADIEALGALLAEHWEWQRSLHPGISTGTIDQIMLAAHGNGALGGKALGASGGGCVVLVASDGAEQQLREAVEPYGEVLPFHVDAHGLQLIPDSAER